MRYNLDILTEQLVDFGSKVLANRLRLLKTGVLSNDLHGKITNQKETLAIEYDATSPLESEDVEKNSLCFSK